MNPRSAFAERTWRILWNQSRAPSSASLLNPEKMNLFIDAAIEEANKAYQKGEVPVGAVIARDDTIISRAHNLIETNQDATSHAEILAIKEASKFLNNWRLNNCTLYVTLEPCVMCMGAIHNSRIQKVVFGAYDKVAGACGSVVDMSFDNRAKRKIECLGGVMDAECLKILQDFFKERRQ